MDSTINTSLYESTMETLLTNSITQTSEKHRSNLDLKISTDEIISHLDEALREIQNNIINILSNDNEILRRRIGTLEEETNHFYDKFML